jgi:hypothetical protein
MSKGRIASTVAVLALGLLLGITVNTLFASLSNRASAVTEAQTSGTQGNQRAWEYRTVMHTLGSGHNGSGNVDRRLETDLNNLGRQGFEVCEIMQYGEDQSRLNYGLVLVVLRRPGR